MSSSKITYEDLLHDYFPGDPDHPIQFGSPNDKVSTIDKVILKLDEDKQEEIIRRICIRRTKIYDDIDTLTIECARRSRRDLEFGDLPTQLWDLRKELDDIYKLTFIEWPKGSKGGRKSKNYKKKINKTRRRRG